MSIEIAAVVLGSFFTGVSVLVGLVVFRRQEDRDAFSRFRMTLVELRQAIAQLNNLLSESTLTEVSLSIAAALRSLIPEKATAASIRKYLLDKKHHDYVAQAIHIGLNQSESLVQARETISRIERLPFEYQDRLPLVSSILRRLIRYIRQSAEGVFSPRLFNEVIGKPENLKHVYGQFVKNALSVEDVFRSIALLLAAGSETLLKGKVQGVFDSTEELINAIVKAFSLLSDAKLRLESSRQKRNLKRIEQINNKTAAEDAFDYLKICRHLFEEESWNSIVEVKTKLYELAHPQSDQ